MRIFSFLLALLVLPAAGMAQLPSPRFQGLSLLGELSLAPSSASSAGLNMAGGVAPTSCKDGDMWHVTGSGFFGCNTNGVTVGPFASGASISPSAANNIAIYTGASTIGGLSTLNNAVLCTNGSGVPSLCTTLPAGLNLTGITPTLNSTTIVGLPAVTSSNKGQIIWVTDCLNGSQSAGSGTGCIYTVNDNGVWVPNPAVPTQGITVGGQLVLLGGQTFNQGNGPKISLATGTFTPGNCRQTDANGNEVDSGNTCGGGAAGTGTIAAGLTNQVAFYNANGTTVAGLTVVNNAVLATGAGGVPSEVTTLPAGLTIPTGTFSGATLTGTTTQSTTNMTGKWTSLASATGGAGINCPQGTAPTSPANGDIWCTSSGVLARIGGSTQGPFIGTVNTTSPLGGGGQGPVLTITCTTCALTTNGGALTSSNPITISAAGLIALGLQPAPISWIADSATTVHNDTIPLIESWPYANSGTINSFTYHTGGTNTPSFTASLQINGVAVTGCTSISVSSSSDNTATCSAAKTITNGQSLTLVITGTSGTPFSSVVQVNLSKPAS